MSTNEDAYFAREEAEKLHRMAAEKREALSESEADKLKDEHWMHCPKCGHALDTIKWRTVEIDKCFHCGVVVLDKGELERLAGEEDEGSFVRSFFEIFAHKPD